MRMISTPMVPFITPFGMVCTLHFLQCMHACDYHCMLFTVIHVYSCSICQILHTMLSGSPHDAVSICLVLVQLSDYFCDDDALPTI